MTHPTWHGVYPALTTKFKPDYRLDPAAMEKHFAWQVECGVDGLIVCGSLGEIGLSSGKAQLLRGRAVSAGRFPAHPERREAPPRASRFAALRARGRDGFMVRPGCAPVGSRDTSRTIAHRTTEPQPIWFTTIIAYARLTPRFESLPIHLRS